MNKRNVSKGDIAKAKSVDLKVLIENVLGYSFKKSGKYYIAQEHDSLNICLSKEGHWQYTWHSLSQRGDSIEFVQRNITEDFVSAVMFLLNFEGNSITAENKKIALDKIKSYQTHDNEISITYSNDMKRTFAYLCKTRGISYDTVALFVHKGLVAQDNKGNIIFKHNNFNNKLVGAELKGTCQSIRFRGTAKGSNEQYGFSYTIGKPNKLFVFEAEIDLISFYDMYHKKLKDCLLLATSGANKYMKIATYLSEFNMQKLIFCMDNDKAGDIVKEKVVEAYSQCQFVDARSELNKYKVKDFNELLLIR